MKKLFLFIWILVLGILYVNAQEEVKWYSIEEAMELALQEPRVLVVDVYTDWCGWCKRMDATTFSNPAIASYMNDNFYPVKLNAEEREDITIGDKTFKFVENGRNGYHQVAAIVSKGRLSYPTISYVDHNGKVLEASPGYKTPDQLKVYLSYFTGDTYKIKSFNEFKESFLGEL